MTKTKTSSMPDMYLFYFILSKKLYLLLQCSVSYNFVMHNTIHKVIHFYEKSLVKKRQFYVVFRKNIFYETMVCWDSSIINFKFYTVVLKGYNHAYIKSLKIK
jgi:hypothetical protein